MTWGSPGSVRKKLSSHEKVTRKFLPDSWRVCFPSQLCIQSQQTCRVHRLHERVMQLPKGWGWLFLCHRVLFPFPDLTMINSELIPE